MLRLAEIDPHVLLLFDGSGYGPAVVEDGELVAGGGVAPEWLVERLAASGIEGAEVEALLDRAPLDIRVNTLKASRDTIDLPERGEELAVLNGLRFPTGTNVEQWPQYAEGLFEVQDCGSQLACEAVDADPGAIIVDLCAGAGGKTLALAARMSNAATLIAADSDRGRLSRLAPRALRAGAHIDHTVEVNPGRELEALDEWRGKANVVLVDAPCSGTGTWRRKPEARWRLTESQLARYVKTQAHLIDIASELVAPGGQIVYVVCSLLDEEGAGQVDAFLARNERWAAEVTQLPLGRQHGSGVRLTPFHDDTDGFFIARIGKS